MNLIDAIKRKIYKYKTVQRLIKSFNINTPYMHPPVLVNNDGKLVTPDNDPNARFKVCQNCGILNIMRLK